MSRDEREHEWQMMFEVCSLEKITETYQFSGLLAKCLVGSEPCHYMNINEVGLDSLDIGGIALVILAR